MRHINSAGSLCVGIGYYNDKQVKLAPSPIDFFISDSFCDRLGAWLTMPWFHCIA